MKNPNCRSCHNSSKQALRAKHVFGGRAEHNFWQCGHCELVYLYPIPSQKDENKFYANEFEKFMEKRSGADKDWSGPEKHISSNQDNVVRRMEKMRSFFVKNGNILEIGCSSGFMMDAFLNSGMKVIGIEPSGGFSEFLKKRGHEYYSSTKELLIKKPGIKFDIIAHFFVLEHIRETAQFIEEQLAMLNTGGIIFAEVPCVYDPLTNLYNISDFEKFYWSIAHHYYFSPKSISYVLDKINCSYEIIPEQRYDLSNHIKWHNEGKPGGQGIYNEVFSKELNEKYKTDLIDSGHFDTFFLVIHKK